MRNSGIPSLATPFMASLLINISALGNTLGSSDKTASQVLDSQALNTVALFLLVLQSTG
jgi:hypothetical protein